jgi:4-aminobutyrate aminotransferase-like enzyme
LGQRLAVLKDKHPARIADVRGRGLLWGVELKPVNEQVARLVARIFPDKLEALLALTGAIVLSELFHAHNVLAYLGFTRRNLIVFSPALVINKTELDSAVAALEAVLSKDWLTLGRSFIARYFSFKR